jgi:hypothetical protein
MDLKSIVSYLILSSNKGTNLNSPSSCFSNCVSFTRINKVIIHFTSPNGITSLPLFFLLLPSGCGINGALRNDNAVKESITVAL